nr:immunoglobulin heavy chain junction region [Mus musculus]NSM07944.1 immunoglobulin heavy chain junction region [Mus musculus]
CVIDSNYAWFAYW